MAESEDKEPEVSAVPTAQRPITLVWEQSYDFPGVTGRLVDAALRELSESPQPMVVTITKYPRAGGAFGYNIQMTGVDAGA